MNSFNYQRRKCVPHFINKIVDIFYVVQSQIKQSWIQIVRRLVTINTGWKIYTRLCHILEFIWGM